MKDIVGLSVLAILLTAMLRLFAGATDWVVLSLVAFGLAAPAAWYTWREPRSPERPLDWLLMAVGTVVLGAVFFAIDASFGQGKDTNASLWQAAQTSGGIFGLVFTALVCPGLTSICIAGAARAAYGRWTAGQPGALE